MPKKLMYAIIICILCIITSGCKAKSQPATKTFSVSTPQQSQAEIKTILVANPQLAVDSCVAVLTQSKPVAITSEEIAKILGDNGELVEQYFGIQSPINDGLATVLVLSVSTQSKDLVRESLYLYKEFCIKEYESYDILDAYAIAQSAIVYDQGEYLVFVMAEDIQSVRDTIDQYMPL